MPKIPLAKKSSPLSLSSTLPRGKYAHFKVSDVIEEDPKYIEYCIENWDNFELDNEAYEKYTRYLDMNRITKLNNY